MSFPEFEKHVLPGIEGFGARGLYDWEYPEIITTARLPRLFALYASNFWYIHQEKAERGGTPQADLGRLLSSTVYSRTVRQWWSAYGIQTTGRELPEMPLFGNLSASQPVAESYFLPSVFAAYGLLESLKTGIRDLRFSDTATDNLGRAPLHLAAYGGHEHIVRFLLNSEIVEPDIKDVAGNTPLHYAACTANHTIAKLLVEREDVDRNSKNYMGETPFHVALKTGSNDVVRFLASRRDVDVNFMRTKSFSDDRFRIVRGKGILAVLKTREDFDLNALWPSNLHRNPLESAFEEGASGILRHLLSTTLVDLDTFDGKDLKKGSRQLIELCKRNRTQIGPHYQSLLSQTAEEGYENVCKLLLAMGYDAKEVDEHGREPLYYAAINGHLEATVVLLDAGSNPTAKDDFYLSPVRAALLKGHGATVRVLAYAAKRQKFGRQNVFFNAVEDNCPDFARAILGPAIDFDWKDIEAVISMTKP